MFEYSIESDLELSYRKPPITRDRYHKYIEYVKNYGTNQLLGRSRMKTYSDISVIIVAYNETGLLIKCLDHIFNQDKPAIEVILIDNGLDVETTELLRNYTITHIRTVGNLGPSIGRNIGAAFSSADLLAFIDADGYVPRNYLGVAARSMIKDNIVALRGKVKPTSGSEVKYRQLIGHYDFGVKSIPSMIDTEGNAIFRKIDFLLVGGYEDALYGGEGPVLCYRMIEFYGYDRDSFYYEPELVLYHDFHRDLDHLYDKYQTYLLLRYKTSLRYPFLGRLSNYYQSLRTAGTPLAEDEPKDDIAKIVSQRENLQIKFSENLEDYYRSNAKRRLGEHITEGTSHRFTVIIQGDVNGDQLTRTIDSVLKQTLRNIEVIVVQQPQYGPSSPGALSKLPNCIRLLAQGDVSDEQDALNRCIGATTSPYNLRLREGERIDPTYLEKAESVFDGYPDAGIVSCYESATNNNRANQDIARNISIKDIAFDRFLPNGSCFRRDLSIKAGLFDGSFGEYQDWDHWIGIANQGFIAKVIPEALFFPGDNRIRKDIVVDSVKREQLRRMIEKNKLIYDSIYPDIIASKQVQIESQQNNLATTNTFNISSPPTTAILHNGKFKVDGFNRLLKAVKNLFFRPVAIAFSSLIGLSTMLLMVTGYLLDSLTGSTLLLVLSAGLFTEILMLLVVWLHYHKLGIY